ncbi:MAG: UDP-2,3-diacylglucosamine diphosphatase [Rikenellaceae bacterium]
MIYFASDVHLGGGDKESSRLTEQRFIAWIDSISADAEAIILCGDVFDFWFEYKRVVPKGFVRTLARLASLTDSGVRVLFFTGNHDMWVRDYLELECGMEIYTAPKRLDLNGKKVHIAHGDNLSPRDGFVLRLMNATFRSKVVRWLFSTLVHPDWALKFGLAWSNSSRKKHDNGSSPKVQQSKQALVRYAIEQQMIERCDYYIFGHLHINRVERLDDGAEIVFVNDWSHDPHYAVMDDEGKIKLVKV